MIMNLPRDWLKKTRAIPHFATVIDGVGDQEGVEITMNCNYQAFEWIVDIVKIKSRFIEADKP